MGYNKHNEDDTGLLSLDLESSNPYKIVHDIKDAMKFPSKNVKSTKGFGTPEQWLKFFNTEPLLEDWKFHLISIKNA